MATPPFQIQLVDADGLIIRTPAGGRQEADLIEVIVAHVMSRGVGFFRSSKHVEQDVRDGVAAAMHAIKLQNPFDAVTTRVDEN